MRFQMLGRFAQVALITVILVFGSLLVIGSFDIPGWSDAHHGYESYVEAHGGIFLWYIGGTYRHVHYKHSGHGDTIHD